MNNKLMAGTSRSVLYQKRIENMSYLQGSLAVGLHSRSSCGNLVADRAFKKHKTTVKPFEISAVLMTCGIFRITGNPIYLGFVLILIGISIFMGSLTPYVVIPVLAVLVDVVFIGGEQKMLEETFGER